MISNKNILELELRRAIYRFIINNPGLHQRELSREMKIPKTTLLHHIRVMEKNKLINIKHKNGYQRIYVHQELSEKEKNILNLIRQKIPQLILLYFIFKTACSQIELCKELEQNPSIISYHLSKLKDIGLIEEVAFKNGLMYRWGNPNYTYFRKLRKGEIMYRIKTVRTQRDICNMLIVYKDKLYHKKTIDSTIKLMKILGTSSKILKNEVVFDKIIDKFYDVFPNPYYI